VPHFKDVRNGVASGLAAFFRNPSSADLRGQTTRAIISWADKRPARTPRPEINHLTRGDTRPRTQRTITE